MLIFRTPLKINRLLYVSLIQDKKDVMLTDKKRKEIHLPEEVILMLEYQAKRAGRNLKNYIEFVLNQKANEMQPSKEYIQMMDKMLSEVEEGKTAYITESDIRKKYKF